MPYLKKALNNRINIVLLVLSMLIWCLNMFCTFNFSIQDSLKHRHFITFKFIKPQKGDFVDIVGQETKYFGGKSFIKILAGIEGDKIRIEGDKISINDRLVGKIFNETSSKNPLTGIKEGVIPSEYVFVAGTHERSFDSRYKEFGLVHISKIKGVAYGL